MQHGTYLVSMMIFLGRGGVVRVCRVLRVQMKNAPISCFFGAQRSVPGFAFGVLEGPAKILCHPQEHSFSIC